MISREKKSLIEDKKNNSPRFLLLDLLRGLASLAVVFYHWSHFPVSNASENFPLYKLFKLFYDQGFFAVELFFALSGFVFFWLYADRIRLEQVDVQSFFRRRIARIYPLFLITLLVTAFLQFQFLTLTNQVFVYRHNDLYHLFLSLFLASSWGLEVGPSFNGVAWSISVEALLYILFFCSCRYFGVGLKPILFWLGLGIVLREGYAPIGQGLSSFYLGGLVYHAYQKRESWVDRKFFGFHYRTFIIAATIVAWMGVLGVTYLPFLWPELPVSQTVQMLLTIPLVKKLVTVYTVFVLFPLTLIASLLLEKQNHLFVKLSAYLGDISYSIYLWHFPLQLMMVIAVLHWQFSPEIFLTGLFQLGFFLILILLATASFHGIEKPAQRFILALCRSTPRGAL